MYPIGVRFGVLYVFGRMTVKEIVLVDDDELPLDDYLSDYRQWRFLAPTCTTEVVIGTDGTRVHLDRPVPGEILRRLTCRPRRGPRPVKYVNEAGQLTNPVSVQGIYRLDESSVADFDDLLNGAPGALITRARPRRMVEAPPGMNPLF